MTAENTSENVVLSAGAGMMSLMVCYALATDVFGLDRPSSRALIVVSIATAALAGVARYARLRHSGTHLLFFHAPTVFRRDRIKYFLWLVGAAIVGAYSVYEIFMGGFFLGALGCFASVSSMFVLARGLMQPPTS